MSIYPIKASVGLAVLLAVVLSACSRSQPPKRFVEVRSVAGGTNALIEPYGIAVNDGKIIVSDGERGKLVSIDETGAVTDLAGDLDTPSGIAIGPDGTLYAADPGRNAIYKIGNAVSVAAGTAGQRGGADGPAANATFSGPTSVAVGKDGKVFISDTYNDRIRLLENGSVTTLAGGSRGYKDDAGTAAEFDTPLGIAVWNDKLLVADAGNRRIRVIEPDGRVWTLAGNGANSITDGSPADAGFVRPSAIAVSQTGEIYIADANTIRVIGSNIFPFVQTIAGRRRASFMDGDRVIARFDRPSGLAFDADGSLLVADSDNGLVRRIVTENYPPPEKGTATAAPRRFTPEEFRGLQPPRWPYDPPDAKRDIAGTLGEIRGELSDDTSQVWFHSGLDIAGSYGETARFVRAEKVLDPMSTANFGDLRELIRLPLMGYIHIRLGRDSTNKPFGDPRFIFSYGTDRRMYDVRVPRGARFEAGEPVGTLNPMNHVHLIAGPTGEEMNALNALVLPNVVDTTPPVIENSSLWDENWNKLETPKGIPRITLAGKTRIVVRAFDRMDGNPERRKLGIYRAGYQILRSDGSPVSDIIWTISFDRNPPPDAVRCVYAKGSHSGATGETIFNYIVTNHLDAESGSEGFLDPGKWEPGSYTIRVLAADFFGNEASKDIDIEVKR